MKTILKKTAKFLLIGISVLTMVYASSQWVSAQNINGDPPVIKGPGPTPPPPPFK